jgi:hypothetical protein
MNRDEKTKIAAALVNAADVLMDADKSRANKILLRAVSLAKNPMAKEWLRDGKASGTWIRTAADLLERSAPKAAEFGLSEDEVNDQVASMLAWMALSAILRDAKKGAGLLTAARPSKSMDDILGYGERGWKTMKDDDRETLIGNQKLQALIRVRKSGGGATPVLLEREGKPTERFKFVPEAMKAAEF